MSTGNKQKRIEKVINPFLELASGLSVSTEQGAMFTEEVVDIETFVTSKEFLNQGWDGRRGCRPAILEILKEISKDNVREALLLLGKGSGKDYLSAVLHLYGIYKTQCMSNPQNYYGLAPGSPIYFVNTARNDTQAKKVFFTQFKGLLDNCLWFGGKYEEPSLSEVRFDKGVVAISVNSQAFGWLGFNTIQWVGDELAFFLENDSDEGSASRAEECWQAAYGSCQTRFPNYYKMIGITTPRFDDDFVMRKGRELQIRTDGYFIQKATWDIHPQLTKDNFKNEFIRDYKRTMRDFGAIPMGSLEGFWAEPNFIEDNVVAECKNCQVYIDRKLNQEAYECWEYDECTQNGYMGNGKFREWFKPENGVEEYYLHFDLSISKDYLGFALGHEVGRVMMEASTIELVLANDKKKEGSELTPEDLLKEKPLIKFDVLGFINPRSRRDDELIKNGELWYDAIFKKIVVQLIGKGFNITKVTFDSFQSHYFKQNIDELGLDVELLSTDRTDEIPQQAKVAFTENRVFYPYLRRFVKECKELYMKNGKKVEHPEKGSKDCWDSTACVIHSIEKNMGHGGFVDCTVEH
jgi:hypothetical protein